MALQIGNWALNRAVIVDDDVNARSGYEYSIEDLKMEPIQEGGQIDSLGDFISQFPSRGDALLCDYHLQKKNYAVVNGDEIVGGCYKHGIPAVLCTTFTDSDVTLMRGARRFIPSLLKPKHLNPDTIADGWRRCIEEFEGSFRPDRKPWRTLVRIDEVVTEDNYFYVILPSWNLDQKIRFNFSDVPPPIRTGIAEGRRLHAQVNIGAQSHDELYFCEWEEK